MLSQESNQENPQKWNQTTPTKRIFVQGWGSEEMQRCTDEKTTAVLGVANNPDHAQTLLCTGFITEHEATRQTPSCLVIPTAKYAEWGICIDERNTVCNPDQVPESQSFKQIQRAPKLSGSFKTMSEELLNTVVLPQKVVIWQHDFGKLKERLHTYAGKSPLSILTWTRKIDMLILTWKTLKHEDRIQTWTRKIDMLFNVDHWTTTMSLLKWGSELTDERPFEKPC